MIDGKISSNTATNDFGGGIYTAGNFDMKHGEISNNKAVYGGGGIYNVGIFRAFNGCVISNNKAGSNGGGIGVPDVTYLESIYIYDGVVFSNNSALIAYNRDSIHDGLYNSHIDSSVIWTAPFTQGYNNYDISYIGSSPITSPEPTDSPYSPYPSIQPSSPSSSNTEKGYIILGGMALIIGVAIILAIISIIAIVVVFLFSKK
jgi:predicted outer membrane repeat protein